MTVLPSAVPEATGPLANGRVRATTREITDPGDLATLLPARDVVSWVRDGAGLIGWGAAARLRLRGPGAATTAMRWWRATSGGFDVVDEVSAWGTGPLMFGSLPFDERTGEATFVVPAVVIGRRDGRAWLTSYSGATAVHPPLHPVDATPSAAASASAPIDTAVSYADGALSASAWMSVVAAAVRRIQAGEAGKVVLARDLVARSPAPIRVDAVLRDLARRYRSCWTFSVDGLIGATPEMLARRTGRTVLSRVLAGTVPRLADDRGASLFSSAKNRQEHAYAVRSVAETLASYCPDLQVPDGPSLLRLPNLSHLATDLTGTLEHEISALELAGALHPTGAVGGNPSAVAMDLIPQLEQMDRGRYAGPIGWVDRAGDGEWGLALRCAEITGATARMFAGGGIVADSDPEIELAETQAKFLVIRDSLESAVRETASAGASGRTTTHD
ncbi:MAG: isochorismate synthase [Mycobacteriales bacterium]